MEAAGATTRAGEVRTGAGGVHPEARGNGGASGTVEGELAGFVAGTAVCSATAEAGRRVEARSEATNQTGMVDNK